MTRERLLSLQGELIHVRLTSIFILHENTYQATAQIIETGEYIKFELEVEE